VPLIWSSPSPRSLTSCRRATTSATSWRPILTAVRSAHLSARVVPAGCLLERTPARRQWHLARGVDPPGLLACGDISSSAQLGGKGAGSFMSMLGKQRAGRHQAARGASPPIPPPRPDIPIPSAPKPDHQHPPAPPLARTALLAARLAPQHPARHPQHPARHPQHPARRPTELDGPRAELTGRRWQGLEADAWHLCPAVDPLSARMPVALGECAPRSPRRRRRLGRTRATQEHSAPLDPLGPVPQNKTLPACSDKAPRVTRLRPTRRST
jgi:hypothetical protein